MVASAIWQILALRDVMLRPSPECLDVTQCQYLPSGTSSRRATILNSGTAKPFKPCSIQNSGTLATFDVRLHHDTMYVYSLAMSASIAVMYVDLVL